MDALEITRRIQKIEQEIKSNRKRIRQPADDQPVVRGPDTEPERSPEAEKAGKQ